MRGSGLILRQEDPFNAETPFHPDSPRITPVDQFYVRNHFSVPESPSSCIVIDGALAKEIEVSVEDLARFPQHSLTTTMECAGNGRTYLSPPTSGVQWELGAVATATWSGTLLTALL